MKNRIIRLAWLTPIALLVFAAVGLVAQQAGVISYGPRTLLVPEGAGLQVNGTLVVNREMAFSAGTDILMGTINGEGPRIKFGDGFEALSAEIDLPLADGRICRMIYKSGSLVYSSCR